MSGRLLIEIAMPTKPTGRPRGRPPGAKNRPKTIEEFVFRSIQDPVKAPQRPEMRGGIGIWASMGEEERTAYSVSLRAARSRPTNQTPGKPRSLTNVQWVEVQATARLDAEKIIQKMTTAGQIPEDPMAAEALATAIRMLRASQTPKDIATLARLVLDFTKAKPVQKSEVTIRTHEDFLDELSGDN